MAWIESHQSLLTHRKLLRLANKTKCDKYKLIGHLHALWWWGLDNAQNDGSLGETFPEEIAAAAGWPDRTGVEFVNALVFAGFLEENPAGVYALHNWQRYAGKLNEKKEKDRERKRGKKPEVAGNSSGIPTEVAGKSQAPNQPYQPVPSELPTYLTEPDQTTPTVAVVSPGIFDLYSRVFGGGMTDFIRDELIDLEREHSATCLERHFTDAAMVIPRPRSLKYVTTKLSHTREECDQPPRTLAVSGVRPKSLLYED